MFRTEEWEQLLDYVELALAIAEEEDDQYRHPCSRECETCSLCSMGVVRTHLQEAHNALIQIEILE